MSELTFCLVFLSAHSIMELSGVKYIIVMLALVLYSSLWKMLEDSKDHLTWDPHGI
jgi:hypothetical protein